MRHAFSTLGCSDLSLTESQDLAARYRVEAIELRGLGGELDLPAYFSRTFGSPIRERFQGSTSKTELFALDTSLSLVGCNALDREEFLSYVPWAEALGVPWLRVFDGKGESGSNYLAKLRETLRWWTDLKYSHGWNTEIMIETHDGLVTSEAISALIGVEPGISILWDAHNTWRKGGEDPCEVWPQIRTRTVHIHVKDSVNRPSARHPFTYTLPGAGEFPMADLRYSVEASGYGGLLSLEWERRWHPYLPPLNEALEAANHGWW